MEKDSLTDSQFVKTPNGVRSKKSAFCKFYRRGCCTFTASECKFAHGVDDYNFVGLKPENYRSKTFPPKNKNNTSKKVVVPAKDEDEEDEELDAAAENKKENASVPSTIYKNFYEYQFLLKERGETTEIYSQEVINEDKEIRATIRRKLNFDLQTGLLDVVFEKYNTKALKKSLVEQYFLHANWMIRWKFLLSKNYIYEIKSFPSELYIAKQLPPKEFDEYMKDCVIKIIKEKQLFDQLPISPTIIIRHYYQYLGSLDPLMPSHITYLRLREFKSMDDYLNHLQDNTDFVQKLLETMGKNESDFPEGLKIFGNVSQEIKGLKEQIKVIILELLQSSSTGLISLSDCEKAIAKKSLPAAKHYFNNQPQLRKIILSVLLDKELATINLDSEIYVFSPAHFHKVDQAPLTENLHKQIYSKCSLGPITSLKPLVENHTKPSPFLLKSQEPIDDHQLDLNKVVLVNDQQSLELAINYFSDSDVDQIGVDLEGLLKDNIHIELVQCSSKDKIFIFDVYSVYLSAIDSSDSQPVYFNLIKFLKELMEDPTKCKIFHDCRQDSAALHAFFNICPSNIFDLSAVYMLIEYIKRSLDKKEDTLISEEIKLPGLNEILEKYQAIHGINKLKNVMKERFRKFPREYFLQRPIDQEFFVYSAKDVEDLVEIRQKMQSTLGSLFHKFIGQTITEDKLDFLCKKVSKIYSQNGCSSLNK